MALGLAAIAAGAPGAVKGLKIAFWLAPIAAAGVLFVLWRWETAETATLKAANEGLEARLALQKQVTQATKDTLRAREGEMASITARQNRADEQLEAITNDACIDAALPSGIGGLLNQ